MIIMANEIENRIHPLVKDFLDIVSKYENTNTSDLEIKLKELREEYKEACEAIKAWMERRDRLCSEVSYLENKVGVRMPY